ncbi:DUF707 domain-containing protein [Shewanella sp. MBTL60-007]|uniref:DUF707 domain-containing protein n=1 Tax=Shewanella sp. MBTL60-007 TaxID=2815911 RepID=UPI001BC652EC|nr:DUF707 domain-containing protein [Shewanella sp. MBTL60-007]GIU25467.1 hypothetical protein TUM3792_31250 [Shewanella sp. MBTL60-007]
MKKFLVIARVGDNSLHPHWLENKTPNFDLFLSYFGDKPNHYQAEATYYEQVKGGKWPILHKLIEANWAIISQYEAVWLPDDDILVDAETINKMFTLFNGFDLTLAQPALTMDSYFSHSSLLRQPHSVLRYCNFVEVMVPIFSASALLKLKESFDQSPSGWGLDALWPHLIDNTDLKKIAVIDATPVVHTRPVGGELYKLNPELSPEKDAVQLQDFYPQFNICRRHAPNKFKVFSQITESQICSPLMASIKGKYQRVIAKYKAKKHPKFPSK